MNKMTAVKFRIILSVLLVAVAALMVGAFVFGYRHLKTVGQDVATRQADATASEDSINSLRRLQTELDTKKDIMDKLASLRSSHSLPQFDTEKSLRTISQQLGLSVKNVTFINDAPKEQQTSSSSTSTSAPTNNTGQANNAASGQWGSRNSKISFEFSRNLSYAELIRFYNAIETSTPKLRLDGLTIPSDAKRNSINPGTLTLELATQ